jgi:two-component system sensor histidine kinase/response regulator
MMSRGIMRHLWLILIVFLSMAIAPVESARQDLHLTEGELSFIRDHPVIRLGVDPRFVPFEFIDDDGEHVGIAADYLALIAEITRLTFRVQKGLSWPEA